jgi:hypothetical protein
MGRGIHRLSPAGVRNAKVGRHADGGNLYLEVEPGAHGLTRKWLFRYAVNGRERVMVTYSRKLRMQVAIPLRKIIVSFEDQTTFAHEEWTWDGWYKVGTAPGPNRPNIGDEYGDLWQIVDYGPS